MLKGVVVIELDVEKRKRYFVLRSRKTIEAQVICNDKAGSNFCLILNIGLARLPMLVVSTYRSPIIDAYVSTAFEVA